MAKMRKKVGTRKAEVGTKGRKGGSRRARNGSESRKPPSEFFLGQNNYGKSRVRMVKVSRKGRTHTVRELEVAISLTGDFDAIHVRGDNSKCLPTDTMKNTVYAIGKHDPIASIEEFAMVLANHFVREETPVERATVSIKEVAWERVRVGGQAHPHCFVKGSEERRTCEVSANRQTMWVSGLIENLVILKSTDSAFSGFPRDRFTTLAETEDRIFATSVTARWEFEDLISTKQMMATDFEACRENIRAAIIRTFAGHKSQSVQHTLYAMGEAALRACKNIKSIRLSMPNKHCLLVNLKPFGMANSNEIFVPTDEPHGLIEAEIHRGFDHMIPF